MKLMTEFFEKSLKTCDLDTEETPRNIINWCMWRMWLRACVWTKGGGDVLSKHYDSINNSLIQQRIHVCQCKMTKLSLYFLCNLVFFVNLVFFAWHECLRYLRKYYTTFAENHEKFWKLRFDEVLVRVRQQLFLRHGVDVIRVTKRFWQHWTTANQ